MTVSSRGRYNAVTGREVWDGWYLLVCFCVAPICCCNMNRRKARSYEDQKDVVCERHDLLENKWSNQLLNRKPEKAASLERFIPHIANQQGLIKCWAGWGKRLFKIEFCNNCWMWYRWTNAAPVKEIHISIRDAWEQVNKLVNKGEPVDIICIDMQKVFGQSP